MNKQKKVILGMLVLLTTSTFGFTQNSSATKTKIRINSLDSLKEQTEEIPERLTANPQLANASSDYLVTAGDIYQLSFAAGTTPVSYMIQIDSSYNVKIANLATINGEGKTFIQLKKQVEDIVNRNYPMGGVQFLIYAPAIFKVAVKGEVNETIEKQVWALDRVSTLLADNLTSHASTRFVKIISKSGKTTIYDLFEASRNGDMSQNPYLRPDDTVEVLRYSRKIVIGGAVERPGEYEIKDGENFLALINKYAGGLDERADTSKVEILRTYNQKNTSGVKIYPSEDIFDNDYDLKNEDNIYIFSFKDFSKVIFFEGAIEVKGNNPLKEEITSKENVSQKTAIFVNDNENYTYFLRKNIKYFSLEADLKNAYIIRGTEIIPVDLQELLYNKNSKVDINIESYDILRVPFLQYFVTVAGAVKNPGRYPYVPDRSWDYYVGLAGGFDKSKNAFNKIEIVDKNNKKLSKDKLIEPETTITASYNSFTYYFSTYAPFITTTLTAVSTAVSIIAVVSNYNK